MQKELAECDEIFGKDINQTAQRIKDDPNLLNKLPCSVTPIKEILRLYPPASSIRACKPGFFLHHDGNQYNINHK